MAKKSKEEREFLQRHHLDGNAFSKIPLSWKQLVVIKKDFEGHIPNLSPIANYAAETLRQLPEVHSVRSRVKDPDHLIAKIVRKQISGLYQDVDETNYRERVTDLIGLRVLHLFKHDWPVIHKFVVDTWELYETPVANIRRGDPEKQFTDLELEVKEHKAGYRSIHYLVKSMLAKQPIVVEVQVRTIFEEGWSEIDHDIRYPNQTDQHSLNDFLVMFNRLAGMADEMGSYIHYLKTKLRDDAALLLQIEAEREISRREYDRAKLDLEEALAKLEISENQRKELAEKLARLKPKSEPSLPKARHDSRSSLTFGATSSALNSLLEEIQLTQSIVSQAAVRVALPLPLERFGLPSAETYAAITSAARSLLQGLSTPQLNSVVYGSGSAATPSGLLPAPEQSELEEDAKN